MLTTEAGKAVAMKGAMVGIAACLLTACAFQTGICGTHPKGKLTYYIASIREKKIQGNWGERAQWVQRQETADGRWALETVGVNEEKAEDTYDAKFLDSSGAVIWEGRYSYSATLSPVAPAFATFYCGGPGLQIYNMDVGLTPVFTAPEAALGGVLLSRDGSVFGFTDVAGFALVSVRGELLGHIRFPDSFAGISIAIADSGRYVAFGGTDPWVPAPASAVPVPADSFPAPRRLMVPTGPDGRPMQDRRDSIPNPVPMVSAVPMTWANSRVVVLDRTGKVAGTIHLGRWLPYCVTFSNGDPPLVTISRGRRISMWDFAGHRIWEDSLTLERMGCWLGEGIKVTETGCAIAVIVGPEDDANLLVWTKEGALRPPLALPSLPRPTGAYALAPVARDSSIVIQTEHMAMTVRESSRGN
ncbi:MAG: hypothetical protein AB1792_08165 [Candidatus Zixiibacteriota bacterium]